MRKVGIITALRAEARCITTMHLSINQAMPIGEQAVLQLSGMGADAARNAAENLCLQGADALVS